MRGIKNQAGWGVGDLCGTHAMEAGEEPPRWLSKGLKEYCTNLHQPTQTILPTIASLRRRNTS